MNGKRNLSSVGIVTESPAFLMHADLLSHGKKGRIARGRMIILKILFFIDNSTEVSVVEEVLIPACSVGILLGVVSGRGMHVIRIRVRVEVYTGVGRGLFIRDCMRPFATV